MDIYSEKKAVKDLNSLYAEAVYGKPKAAASSSSAPKKMIVTRADKKANTKAYQNYKAGAKGYEAADHLKNEEYGELYSTVYSEDEKYGYDKDGNSLNPVDIEKKKKKDDDLAGAPNKKAKKDYDGDGEVETPEAEYKGSKDKAIKKSMKKESFSNWRDDLTEIVDEPESKASKKVKESNVKNKVVIDPEIKLEQALGGKVESIEEDKDTKIKEEILLDRAVVALIELEEMIGIDEAQTAYEKARKAAARRAADRNAARRRGEMGGRMERETYTNEAGKEMHYKGYSA